MTSIYFPHTFISDKEGPVLSRLFGPIKLYLPSDLDLPQSLARLAQAGDVALSFPFAKAIDKKNLRAALAQCRTWGEQGGSAQLALANKEKIPFFDDSSIAHIRSAINRQIKEPAPKDKTSSVLADLVFLHIAQNLDSEYADIKQAMQNFQDKEKSLLHELSEPGELLSRRSQAPLIHPDNPKSRNMKSRMAAWTRLFLADKDAAPGFFMTTSPEAVEIIADKSPKNPLEFEIPNLARPIKDGPSLSRWREAFSQCLKAFISGKTEAQETLDELSGLPDLGAPAESSTVSPNISLFDENPYSLFSRSLKKSGNAPGSEPKTRTAICVVQLTA